MVGSRKELYYPWKDIVELVEKNKITIETT
jgi:hypothetical protein